MTGCSETALRTLENHLRKQSTAAPSSVDRMVDDVELRSSAMDAASGSSPRPVRNNFIRIGRSPAGRMHGFTTDLSDIGSQSWLSPAGRGRSAGNYLRIGRSAGRSSWSNDGLYGRAAGLWDRNTRSTPAGKYLRIGRSNGVSDLASNDFYDYYSETASDDNNNINAALLRPVHGSTPVDLSASPSQSSAGQTRSEDEFETELDGVLLRRLLGASERRTLRPSDDPTSEDDAEEARHSVAASGTVADAN